MSTTGLVALFLILLVAGHFVGRTLPSNDEEEQTPSAIQPRTVVEKSGKPIPKSYSEAVVALQKSSSASADDFPALMRAAIAEEDPSLRRYLSQRIAARWAEVDPIAGYAWLHTERDRQYDRGSMNAFLAKWAEIDPVAAFAAVKEPDYDDFSSVFRIIARNDPALFLQLEKELGGVWRSNNYAGAIFQTAFEQIAEDDPTKLAEWMDDEENITGVRQSAAVAFAELAIRAGGGGLEAIIAGITDPDLRTFAINKTLEQLITRDLNAAENFFDDAIAAGTVTPDMGHRLLHARAIEDPFEAARMLQTWSENTGVVDSSSSEWLESSGGYFSTLSRSLPPDGETLHAFATEFGDTLPGFNINNLVNAAGFSFGRPSDRSALANQLLEMPQGSIRDEMLVAVVYRWMGDSPAAATEFAENMRDVSGWQAAHKDIMNTSDFTSADEVFDLVEEIGWPGALPRNALNAVVADDPERAAEYIAGLDQPEGTSAAPVLARSLARLDPAQGIEWIENMEAGAAQVAAARAFAKASTYDTYALSEWAATIEPGPMLDVVAAELSQSVARQEPGSAFAWALAIGDAGSREAALQTAVDSWQAEDLEAVMEAVSTNERLSDTERQQLLQRLDQEEAQ